MPNIYDKNRRPIEVGDVLKIFHFTAALRREAIYMYKQVLRKTQLQRGSFVFEMSHLEDQEGSPCRMLIDDKVHDDYEIVQGKNYREREKLKE
ncbi:MAG: hypothetical protein PHS93_09410 [Candidatus Omnitrophica bacterium]|nr:hypothetical protein [Candidatus Omnitrophota bacterium]MDD5353364.1 hypothetical protein [Candidatus Omnitrophota bacterium]